MALPKKPAKPSQAPVGPPKPARSRDDDELARKKKKAEDDEEDDDEKEEDDDDAEDDEDTLEADEEEEDDEEEADDEEVDDEELDEEEDLDEEDLDEEDLDEEDLDDDELDEDDEDLDDEDDEDDEDFDDDEDDEDDDDEDDDDEDDEDDDDEEDDEDEDEGPKRKKKKKKKARGEAGSTSGDGAKVAVIAAAGVAAGALAATALAKKTSGIAKKVDDPAAAKSATGINKKIDADALAKKTSGIAKNVESPAADEATATGATKTAIKPMSKKGPVLTANKSGRVAGASSATGTSSRRQAGAAGPAVPAKKDKFKAIAIAACALLFLACVGVGAYIIFFKPSKRQPVEKYSAQAQKLVDMCDQADKDYEIAQTKKDSDKIEDKVEARDKMLHAVELWNKVFESNQMVPGAEEKINHARQMAETVDKQARELSEVVTKLEMEERIRKSNERKKNAPPTTTPDTAAPTPPKQGEIEWVDEAEWKKMETGDPSEYERIQKALKTGKAKFKGKDDAPKDPAPAPAPAADAPKAGAIEMIDEAAWKKMENDDPSEYERIGKALKAGKAKLKGKDGDAAPAPADKPAEAAPEKKADTEKLPDKAPAKPVE